MPSKHTQKRIYPIALLLKQGHTQQNVLSHFFTNLNIQTGSTYLACWCTELSSGIKQQKAAKNAPTFQQSYIPFMYVNTVVCVLYKFDVIIHWQFVE